MRDNDNGPIADIPAPFGCKDDMRAVSRLRSGSLARVARCVYVLPACRPIRETLPVALDIRSHSNATLGVTAQPNSEAKHSPKLSEAELETAILKALAAGGGDMDEQMANGVSIIEVLPTEDSAFPKAWSRRESATDCSRGAAEWYVPDSVDTSRRMLFLHGGGFMRYAAQDPCYRSLASSRLSFGPGAPLPCCFS